MTDPVAEKTDLEKSRDIISQLKEMRHYSKTTIEKLTEFWLLLDGELKQKKMARRFEDLLDIENKVHDTLEALVSDYETECNRIENEGS